MVLGGYSRFWGKYKILYFGGGEDFSVVKQDQEKGGSSERQDGVFPNISWNMSSPGLLVKPEVRNPVLLLLLQILFISKTLYLGLSWQVGGPEIGKQVTAKSEMTKRFLLHKVNLISYFGGIQENCCIFFNCSCSHNKEDTVVGDATVLKYAHKTAQASVALLGNQTTLVAVLTLTSSEYQGQSRTLTLTSHCFQ